MTRTSLAIAAAAVALTAAWGCTTTRGATSADGPPVTTLEIVNRTPVDLVVSIRGRIEGTVAAGTRLRARHLAPGPAPLVAAIRGEARARYQTEITLAEGDLHRWTIVPEGDAAPLPEPPELTTLRVDNATARALIIRVDGRRVGQVQPRSALDLRDVEAGPRELIATTVERILVARATEDLRPDADNRWEVRSPGARLIVDNDGREPVSLYVDGTFRATIPAGERYESAEERPGPRPLRAQGTLSRTPYETVLDLSLETPVTWRLSEGEAKVEVLNRTGEVIVIALPDREPVHVPDGELATLAPVPLELRELVGVGEGSGLRYATRLALGPGQVYRWTPTPVTPSLRVVNQTRRSLDLYVGGTRLGEIEPDRTVILRDLPGRTFEAELIARDGAERHHRRFDLTDGQPATWSVSATTGSVAIDNRRPERLVVYVDSRWVGEIPAEQRLVFSGLAAGDRLVEARGERSGATVRERVVIAEDAPAEVVFESPVATLEIVNRTGDALLTTRPLSDQHRRIPAGQSQRFTVPARRTTYSVLGSEGAVYERMIAAPPGEVATWEVTPPRANLIVTNNLDEELAVTVDDEAIGSVSPNRQATFPDIEAGRRRLQAVALTSGRVHSLTEVLNARSPLVWVVQVKPGRIVIDNRSAEAVTIAIDGRAYATVQAHARLIIPGIRSGSRRVEGLGDTTRVHRAWTIEVREDQDVVVRVEAPMGTLMVDNQSGSRVRIRIDGEAVVDAEHGAMTPVPAPAGRRRVQVERLDDHTVAGFDVDVVPGTAVHLPIPRPHVRLVVVNQGPRAATVKVGARALGVVEPGGSAIYEDVEIGVADLSALGPDGVRTHAERRRLYPGQTSTWVLAP